MNTTTKPAAAMPTDEAIAWGAERETTMTTREKLERKAERRDEWAESRREAASAAFSSARETASNIPLGQPVLVGHHSESKMRNLYNGIARKMDAGCESAKIADLHTSKAAGIREQLDRSIFSDDPDAVDALQARIAELEAKQEKMKAANKICRNTKTTEAEKAEALRELFHGISDYCIRDMLHPEYSYEKPGFPSYALANNSGNIARLKKRVKEVERRNLLADKAAEAADGVAVTGDAEYVSVTFAKKPEYGIIRDMKDAGFRWGGGSWHGRREALPESVTELL